MPQATENTPNSQKCVARALYDNIAESPDELAFRRGDLLTVLEQNTGGIEGWWLCALRGRQGICPGNRLRLVAGVFDSGGHLVESEGDATLQKLGKRRSWHVQPNKVVTPQRVGDVYLYDLPPGTRPQPAISNSGESYDVPRPVLPCQSYDTPRNSPLPPQDLSSYDVPRPHCTPVLQPPTDLSINTSHSSVDQAYDVPIPQPTGDFSLNASYDVPPPAQKMTPSSSASSLAPESLSNRSSGVEHCQYDIPPPPVKAMHDLSLSHDVGTPLVNPATLLYDVPPTVSKDVGSLPLEQNAALETLSRLEAELLAATSRLLGFVGPEWRTGLDGKTLDLKLAAHRVRTALHDLLRFLESALANAVNAADRCLAPKLRILLRMLRNAESVLAESMVTLDRNEWNSGILIRTDAMSQEIPDALDQLIGVAKDIPDNTRQACGFIQGNAPLLFKREAEAGLKQGEEAEEVSGLEDYDYVNLESKASVARSHAETKAHLAPQLRERYETLINSELEVLSLDPSDQRVLAFFTSQAASHAASLTAAIDAFLLTIEQNQPPASFLAHGKFVVLSAHKLVTIGDAVHRHVGATTVRKRVLDSTNALSDALASAVHKTKRAAMQFPSVTAVQEMVDSVVDISHLSRDLKLQISHAASN